MSSNWQIPRPGEPSRGPSKATQSLRYLTRVGMVAIIFVLAWVRGFDNTAMVYLAGVVVWAACLPILTRGLSNWLSVRDYDPSSRKRIVIAVAIVLLAAIAVAARIVARAA